MSDRGALIGLVLGLFAIFGAGVVEGGGNPLVLLAFLNAPAGLIVFGGTIGATIVAFPLDRVKALPSILALAFQQRAAEERHLVNLYVRLAERARREGLLALENDANEVEDPFMRKGLLLVVDGTDPELVQEVLEADVAAMAERHEGRYAMLEAMGGFAPTMGIIGTVMGLVNVLSHLDKPDELGKSIATAFIATFYGVLSANILWLPLGQRLKQRHKEEVALRHLMIVGIMAVQAGDNPRVVREKMESLVSPAMRGTAPEQVAEAPADSRMAAA